MHTAREKDGLDVVLFVDAYNSWGGYGKPWRKVTSTEEVELAREYWPGHYGLTHLVAFDTARYVPDTATGPDSTGKIPLRRLENRFTLDYKLDLGYPTIVILDRRGVIRARMIGYREEKINAIVDKLLAEPRT